MNWIDDKYKETMGNKKFPSNLKEAGWQNAQALLDKEFPVAAAKGGFIAGKYIIVAMALLIIPAAIWYLNSPTVLPAEGDLIPNEQVKPNLELNDLNSVINTESETESLQKTEDKRNNVIEENLGLQKSNIVSNVESDGQMSVPSAPNLGKTEESGSPSQQGPKDENGSRVTGIQIFESENSPDKDLGEPRSAEPELDGAEANSNAKEEIEGEGKDEAKDPDNKEDRIPENDGNKGDDDVDGMDEEPDAKSPILENKESNSSGTDFENVPNKIDFEENNQEEESDSTGLPNDSQTKIPKADEENLAIKQKTARKDHFAFTDMPEIPDVGDYQLFSRERFSISMWGGYSYVDKFLSGDSKSYLDKRSEEEESIWTASSGFKIDYFLDNRWTFGFGFTYAEYGENINYDISNRDTTKLDGRISSPSNFSNIVEIDSMRIITGINQGHWDYTLITEDGDSSVQENNGKTSWQYLEIPFTVGYRFGNSRIKPWLKTGISLGIPINTNFRYLNAEATKLSDVRLNTSEWVAPLQYNYLFEAGLDCFITRSFSVRLNATSSFQLNSSFQQFSGIRQRYYRLGMSVGLAYNF